MPWTSFMGTTSVPVLCYHNLGGNGVPRSAFAAQMRHLADQGVRTLGLDELAAFVAGGRPLDGPSVMITFDDGFRDLHTFAGPLMSGLGLKGVVFVINNRIRPDGEKGVETEITAHEAHRGFLLRGDRSAWLSALELRNLVEEGVLEAGSHSMTHAMGPVTASRKRDIPDHWAYAPYVEKGGPAPRLEPELAGPLWLDRDGGRPETPDEYLARAVDNLGRSRRELEEILGTGVRSLAWPWGLCGPRGTEAARRAGLDMAFTLARGPVKAGNDPMSLGRLEIRKNKGLGWFKSRLAIHSRAAVAGLYAGVRIK